MGFLSGGSSMINALHAAEICWPREMVGVFVGSTDPKVKSKFYELPNVSSSPEETHTVDPRDIIEAISKFAEETGIDVPVMRGDALTPFDDVETAVPVSFIHSHPGGSWEPSRSDYEGMKTMRWLGIKRAWILAPDRSGFAELPELRSQNGNGKTMIDKLKRLGSWDRGTLTLYDADGLIQKLEGKFLD